MAPNLSGVLYERYFSVTNINPSTINAMIREIESLLKECINAHHRRQLEVTLTNYRAIKNLFDSLDKKI